MAIDFETWKKKREEGETSSTSEFDRWKAWKSSGDKSPSFSAYEKKQKILTGGLQPEDEAYNSWLDGLKSYSEQAEREYKSRENKYQSKSDLGRYSIDAAAHMAQLRTGAEQSRNYYTENRDLYDELYGKGTVDNILSTIAQGTKHLDDISKGLDSEREYWGQWDDGDTYRLAMQAAEEQEQAEKDKAAFISNDSDGYKAYGDNWARYVELSQKQSLTKEEKAEAKAAMKDMQSKYHVVNQSDVFATNMPKDMEKVYIDLTNKSNWGAGITAGFMDAFGVDWLMDKGAQALAAITGQEYSSEDSIQDQFAGIKAAHPGAYTGGNIAGNLAALLAGGEIVKAGSAAIPAMSKLAPVAQKAIQSGATFGLSGGYQALTNTVSKQEWDDREKTIQSQYAQQGIRYDPVDFNAWEQVGNVAAQAGISAVGGAAGSFASSFVGDLGKAFLVKNGLQTPLAEALRQTLSGTAFAAGNTASTYWLYPKENRPSKEKIAQDLAVAFLFSAVTSTISTMQTTKANKAFIDNAVAKMKQDYQRTLNTNMTPAEQVAAFDDILAYNADIRAAISQNYYAGQQKYIDEILRGMDAIDEQITIIKNGVAPGNAPVSNPNVPSVVAQPAAPSNPTPAAPAPQMEQSAPTAITQPQTPVATVQNEPEKPISTMSMESAIEEVRNAGRLNVPYDSVLKNEAITSAISQEEISSAYAEGIAEYNKNNTPIQKQEEPAPAKPAEPVSGGYIASGLQNVGKIKHDGMVFTVTGTASGFYTDIVRDDAVSDGMISNARSKIYHGGPFATRQEAVDDLSAVYDNNLSTKQTTQKADEPPKTSLPTPAVSDTIEAGKEAPHYRLASILADKLISKGTEFNSALLFEQADKAYGGTMAAGAYTVKDAYDALELAVNKTLLSIAKDYNGDTKTAKNAVTALQSVLNKIPTQTKRTDEQQSFQQFSTPPNIAYLAAWAANIGRTDTVLEPSAGIGGLAVFPKAWGATVVVNELSERRLEFLKSMGFDRVFNENAEQINNVLPDDVRPSVVLMNPPFSSTAGRTATNKTENATKHIEQALLRLDDGGRLVAILGRGMADDSRTFAKWWDSLREKYDIRANISIDGSNYRKYGTSFDVQLVVIDKTGPQKGQTITGTFKTLDGIPNVLEGIRNDRRGAQKLDIAGAGRGSDKPVSKGNTSVGGAGNVSHRGDGGSVGGSTVNKPAGTSKGPDKRGAGIQGGNTEKLPANAASENGSGLGGSASATPPVVPERPEQLPTNRPEPKPALPGLKQQRKKAVKSDNGIYAEYVPAELPIKGAIKHPAPLVESAAMAAVAAPVATYKPNLPGELIKSGGLSSAQLENIVYAGQAHQQVLPDGTRKGYFIGDGTGVGKGRQISGIILDNMRQGRKKAVWVSKNLNLLSDAQRDWADIGQSKDDIASQASFKVGTPISMDKGILFTGYDTLRSGKGNDTRISQIVDWVGKDFDGVIAFDEAHNMGNLLGKKGARGMTKGSAKAQAGVDLQRALPNARIVYVSATGATDVNELAYAQRLGLWGRGTAFNDVNDFVSKIGSSGIAAMELVARDMKAMGSYLARSISYDGVTYDTLQHTLTPIQTEIYDTMSHAWQITMQHINEALKVTNANLNPQARSAARSAYYGAMQRFYNQVLTSMSMPSVIEDIKKELAADHSCVLQIVNTNAAEQERQLAKIKDAGGDLEDMDLTPRGTLLGYLENSFPIYAYEEYTDEDGKLRSRIVTDRNGEPVVDREAIAMRDKLIAQVNEMSIPDGPLEMVFDAFGVDAVAEVTGRGRRVVPRVDEKGHTARVEERRTKNHTEADIQAFQDGKKRILVFSDAGGTGKSYHADIRAKNQQKRIHYLVQPGWSASTATQGFGRSHRSNQATTPQFKLVTTNIMGQKRFVSTIARRLDQLGALTKGQRETGSGMFTEKDNLESTLARDSLRLFYERLGRNYIDGIDGIDVLKKLGLEDKFTDEYGNFKIMDENAARDMNTFLNRILALEVDEQNTVFEEFYRIFESQYDKALEDGTLDRGMESVKADKIEIIDDKAIRTDEATGATTNYVQAKTYQKARILSTIKQVENLRSDFMGLYKTENGDVRAVYRVADKTSGSGKVSKMYRLQPPLLGKYSTWSEITLSEKATKLDKGEWTTAWKGEVVKAPEYDERTVHMLTGTLLPIWDRLPQEGNTRAMRITSDDGTQYLGRVIPADQIDTVLRQLGAAGRTRETFTAKDIARRVMAGETARLTRDHQSIIRKRVSGEYRMEITGKNLWYLTRNYPGIITEYIQYEQRYFIPTGEKGEAVLNALIKDNPVTEIYSGSGDVDALISTDTTKQGITSSGTSINSAKLPAVFSKVKFEPGTVNLDIGGGRFDNATEYLAQQGVKSYIYDPYNRSPEHNAASAAATQDGQSDTVTVSNVLNVIKEQDARDEVLLNAVDAVKDGGKVYITIYEGDGKGHGRETPKGWQENRLTSSYIPEARRFFGEVSAKNKVLVCTKPRKQKLTAKEPKSEVNRLASVSAAASDWGKFRERGAVRDKKWDTNRVGSTDKKTMPISDIISKIRHDFGIPIITGHVRGQGVLGQYNNRTSGIRTKIANDLPTVSHELGHHLDRSYSITDDLPGSLRDELVSHMDAALRSKYPANKLVGEGLAEFIRKYLQNRETASIDYPKFTPHFREVVDAETLALIDGFADEINAYFSLDAETAQSSIRDFGEGPRDFRTTGEKTSDAADKAYQAWIDSFHGIKLFDRAAGTTTHMLAINSAYADSVAYSILTGDLTDINGKRVSGGLQQALRGINLKDAKEYKAFGEYLIVRHGPERLAEGMRIFSDDRKNSTAWMNARQSVLEQQYPAFRQAADLLYEFQKKFLQTWGVQTGLVDPESAAQWAERWQYYVPFNRALAKESRIGAKRGFANQNSTIRRARGGGEDFYNPVDNIINNMVKMVNAGFLNSVGAAMYKAILDNDGLAYFIEVIPAPMNRKVYNVSAVKQSIADKVAATDLNEDEAEKVFGIIDGMDDILVQYERGKASGDVITVLIGGKPVYMKVNDPLLLESLTNMSQKETGAVLHALGTVSRFMTANITGLNLIWSIGSNTVRDLGTLLTFTKDKNLVHVFNGIFRAYLNSIRKPDDQDPMYKEFLAMGGGSESVYTADKNMTKDIKDKLAGKKIKWLNPLEWIEVVSNIIERGPRYATYKMMRDRGMSPQEAIYESHDITVNFRRGGSISRQVNKAVPFFNAGVQGADKLLRWITCEDIPKEKRAKAIRSRVMQYFAAFGVLGALQWFINSRDEEAKKYYAQLSTYTKNNFWCIPVYEGGKSTGKYVTIPKPRELAIPASLVSTLLEYGISGNDDAFNEFDEYALGSYLPNIADDVAKGVVGLASGKTSFTDVASSILGNLGVIGIASYMVSNKDFLGRPIESTYYQNLEPKDRYNARTSKAAYTIGQAFNMSPIMIDYALQNFLGGFWKTQKALFPIDPKEADPTMGIGSTYVRDSRYSTDIVNTMYDLKQAALLAKNSDPDNIEKAIAYKESNNMTTFYSRFNKLYNGESSPTRQIVLDMIYDFNKAEKSGYRSELQKKIDALCEKIGDTDIMCTAMQPYIKDDDGVRHELTADEYVEFQGLYNSLYWQYVGAALNSSPASPEMAVRQANARAIEEAKGTMLSRIGAANDYVSELQQENAAGVTANDDILFNAALEAAGADGSLKKQEVIDTLDSMDLTDEQKEYLFGTKTQYSGASNIYKTASQLNDWITVERSSGRDDKAIAQSITTVYKNMYIEYWLAGDQQGMNEITDKLMALDLRKKDLMPYYTYETFIGWIENYMK